MPSGKQRKGTKRSAQETGLVPFLVVKKPLHELRRSSINDALYLPVFDSDPAIQELAKSIEQHGVLEPLAITLDHVILSGHRRYAAARLAGLTTVPCHVVPIHSTDPDFIIRLREHNRQRVKGLDEMTREEVLSSAPEEPRRAVMAHRRQRARLAVSTMPIRDVKRRCRISNAKDPMLKAIEGILEGWRNYWPLTDRQIHYALINDPPLVHASKPGSKYRNIEKCYKSLCDLLTRARFEGIVPFEAIADPTRPVLVWNIDANPQAFVRANLDDFLKGYDRDLQQSQPNHIEIVGEKNTLDNVIRPVAGAYCIPMTIGRGYCSVPPRRAMQQRYERSGKEKLVILALGDFDPEGEDIAHAFTRSMRDDFDAEVEAIKVALTAAQVEAMGLPPEMKAKETSSRYEGFVEQHGDDVFELEAVPPETLQALLRRNIDSVLDVSAFNAEIEAEKRDVAWLDRLRRDLQSNFASLLADADDPEA